LDTVRRRIQAMRGKVEVASLPGEGCLFSIRIPMTLAILDALLVRAGKGLYLLPLVHIRRFFRWEDLDDVTDKPIDLSEWFGGEPTESGSSEGVQIDSPGSMVRLRFDENLGKREAVIQGLGPILSRLEGVNGAAILGDGRVALALDVPLLAKEWSRFRPAEAAT